GYLPWPWRVLEVMLILPRVLRDGAYGCVAGRRHRIAGGAGVCPLPAAEQRWRFLDTMPLSRAG
ncbi:MAG: thiol-disulfide oxidoreductase, partial [Phycisphaerae bacterium]|nr:thiol-disulfide oxidoreductase [Phycisphaerae bacterium]MDW8262773.1 hypothetical protein [Phycisphaerales bacterium]